MTILIVNQNETFLNDVKNAFETQGYKVIATTSERVAERLFFQYNPRAMIFNASLPISKYTSYLKKSRAAFSKITGLSEK